VTRQPAQHGHPVRKGSHKGVSAPVQTPAVCEDGSAPVRGLEGSTCRDGSEPACEDGSEPVTAAAGGIPVCRAATESPGEAPAECGEGPGECPAGEFSCEGTTDSGEAPLACEASGGGEATS
jgi:hypothetical protein